MRMHSPFGSASGVSFLVMMRLGFAEDPVHQVNTSTDGQDRSHTSAKSGSASIKLSRVLETALGIG